MATDATLAVPPTPTPTRPQVVLIGSGLAAAGAFMGVIGIVGVYLAQRARVVATGASWLPEKANIPLTPSNMAFGTMLVSAITLWWGVKAVKNNDRMSAYLALGLTLFFGLAVINATSFIYTQSGLAVATTPGLLFFAATGAHLAMMVAGLFYILAVTFRTLAGSAGTEQHDALLGAALFWYVTVAAHAVIWLAIYITK